jgi:G6PDH family F420-dependent oxidoreductase
MVEIGYALSSEEHRPNDMVRYARRAEEAGFSFISVSDHFHPWISQQGQSPFIWSVLGAIAQVTNRIEVGTGVTCPTMRIHPAIIAQATATVAAMMPGRFYFGVGTGENLNEHVTGERWSPFDLRADMLEEALHIIRLLWGGGNESYYGMYYTVENARLYTLPDIPPPIYISATGAKSAELAGEIGDGLINTSPDAEVVKTFESAGKDVRPKYGQITVCWAEDEQSAIKLAHKQWPNGALMGSLGQELPTPTHFEQAVQMVKEEDVAQSIICGNDPQRHLEAIEKYRQAGYDHVYVHQVGPDQEGFFNFYQQHILPEFVS